MSHATRIADSLVQRLETQYGHLGIDVRLHAANVREMVERLPGEVDNPEGLLVAWVTRDADEHRARKAAAAAKAEADRERYAELQVELYRAVAAGRFTPRVLALVLTQATRTGYPALNPRTVELLRSMGDRWDAAPAVRPQLPERPKDAGATDAPVGAVHGTGTRRSVDARVHP